jgi:hypothetical protein
MDDRVQALAERFTRDAVVELVRDALGRARASVGAGGEVPDTAALAQAVLEASVQWSAWPTPVINATGVVLHTNL